MHLRASFNNRVTRDELKELIMHSALYCGLPAANATMHLAQQVFDDIDAAQGRVVVRVGLPGVARRSVTRRNGGTTRNVPVRTMFGRTTTFGRATTSMLIPADCAPG